MTTAAFGADPTGHRADIEALREMLTRSEQMRDEMHAAQAKLQRRMRGLQIGAGLLVAVGLIITAALWQVVVIARSNQRLSAQIADCTTQGGRCYDESRARSKTNVTAILNANIYLAECTRDTGDVQDRNLYRSALEECVRQQMLSGRQPIPIPSPSQPPTPTPGTTG